MPDIDKLLCSITGQKYNTKELLNLYENTLKYKGVSELDRERIIEAVELQIRKTDTRAANRRFPKLSSRPREVLEELFIKINNEFDLTNNKVKNGVKTGGPMIAGKAPVNMYISYKAADGHGVVVGAYQWTVEHTLKYRVFSYKGMNTEGNEYNLSEFTEETDDMLQAYRKILANLLGAPKPHSS